MPKTAKTIAGEEWRDMTGITRGLSSEDDATLRRARQRIREIRMRPVSIRLRDAAGRLLPDHPVSVRQTGHAFLFGDCLWRLDTLYRQGKFDDAFARTFSRHFTELFNAATSLCYWTERAGAAAPTVEPRQGEWNLEPFAATVDWTVSRGLIAKGHPLFWSIDKCVPDWVKRYDYPTQMKFAEVRVRNIVSRFRDTVRLWDAVNEAMWEPAFKNLARRHWPHIDPIPGIADYVETVLKWCREENPRATYVINDYGMESHPAENPLRGNNGSAITAASQRRRFCRLIEELKQRHSAPDVIGLQSHTGFITPAHQWEVYDQFAATGLPVHITEFWSPFPARRRTNRAIDAREAEYVANYLTTAFGHPAVDAFFFWGFLSHAVGSGASRGPHPLFDAVRALVRDEWTSGFRGRTDHTGTISFRAFLGTYALRAGRQSERTFTVGKSGRMPMEVIV